jgi:hypothetical protein
MPPVPFGGDPSARAADGSKDRFLRMPRDLPVRNEVRSKTFSTGLV